MMNVLLIGSGAREHAIAEAIVNSPKKPKLFAYMKTRNPGISKLAEDTQLGSYNAIEEIKNFAKSNSIDIAVIGPEEPLSMGVADVLESAGIGCVGPKKELARLETSKSFTRLLMKKYNIEGCPNFKVFESIDGVGDFLKKLGEFVVKPDGLTGGKGVKVFGEHIHSIEDGIKYCEEVMKTHPSVVVEKRLEGEEFSLQSFSDGMHLLDCPPVQDHKRAFAGDKGPNTGGMGSYSDSNHLLPFLAKKDVDDAHEITRKVMNAIYKETGQLYKGVMYGGFIVTRSGVKLIEYNARLGDPEAMNVLPLLKTDFIDVCEGIINGTLNKVKAEFDRKATVCKYAVPEGYPTNPVKNKKIDLSDVPGEAKIYYASVDEKNDGIYMGSSRAVAFVGIDYDMEKAEVIAENAVCSVKGPVFHREDIGTKELIEKRISHMKKLRG